MLAVGFDPSGPQYQFVESHPWIPSFGTGYILGIDGIALALIVLTAVLVPLLIVAGWNDADAQVGLRGRSTHTYLALTLAVEGMVVMSLVSLDVLLFYVFFEAMLIPMYFLIGGFGGEQRSKAAVKFLLYNLFGGLIMLAAVVGLYVVTAQSDAFEAGTFDFRAIVAAVSSGALAVNPAILNALFLGFMFAFAVKAPLWPFHRWLPDAAVEATPASAVLMMAIMDKVGTFGMLRYCLQMFPDASAYFRPLIITLAVIGIVYGAILAIGQTDVMRLIAYTSISHFGFIILGIFVMTSQGQSGSDAVHGQPRDLHRRAVPDRRIPGVPQGNPADRRLRRRAEGGAGAGGHLPGGRVGDAVASGPGAVHQRIPGVDRHIHALPGVRGGRLERAGAVRDLHPVDVSADDGRAGARRMADGNDRLRDLVPRELAVVAPLIALLLVLGVYPKVALDVINPAVSHTLTTIDQPDPAPKLAEGPAR